MARKGYMSDDEVHRFVTLQRMVASGQGLSFLSHRTDPIPNGEFDRVLFDLDGLAPENRRALLEVLRLAPPGHSRAVHGYDIDEGEAARLQGAGVAVFRRLDDAVAGFLVK